MKKNLPELNKEISEIIQMKYLKLVGNIKYFEGKCCFRCGATPKRRKTFVGFFEPLIWAEGIKVCKYCYKVLTMNQSVKFKIGDNFTAESYKLIQELSIVLRADDLIERTEDKVREAGLVVTSMDKEVKKRKNN